MRSPLPLLSRAIYVNKLRETDLLRAEELHHYRAGAHSRAVRTVARDRLGEPIDCERACAVSNSNQSVRSATSAMPKDAHCGAKVENGLMPTVQRGFALDVNNRQAGTDAKRRDERIRPATVRNCQLSTKSFASDRVPSEDFGSWGCTRRFAIERSTVPSHL